MMKADTRGRDQFFRCADAADVGSEPKLTDAAPWKNVRFSGRGSQPFKIAFDPFLSETISVLQREANKLLFHGAAAVLLPKFHQADTKVTRWLYIRFPTYGGCYA
jgi:hypothetical protein